MTPRLESWLRILGYAILLTVFLFLAWRVDAQNELNREARYQRWLLINLELADVNAATEEWNNAAKRYKTLDDINSYELLYSLRKIQAANAKIEEHLQLLDTPIGAQPSTYFQEFVCKCGKTVITNNPFATMCDDCQKKGKSP